MSNLVTCEWLSENTQRIGIIDCRFDMNNPSYGLDAYNEGHIRNAVYIDPYKFLFSEEKEHGGRHPLPNMDVFIEEMNRIGIYDKTSLVLYDDGDMFAATRLWFLFQYIGKTNVKILNGGFTKWKELLYSIDEKYNEYINFPSNLMVPLAQRKITKNINESLIVSMEEVQQMIQKNKKYLIDSRIEDRYLGKEEPIDKIPGHIPSAINLPYHNVFKNGYMKTSEELKKEYKLFQTKNYDALVLYCGSGISACINLFALNEIDILAQLYVGSYSDWISYSENQVITKFVEPTLQTEEIIITNVTDEENEIQIVNVESKEDNEKDKIEGIIENDYIEEDKELTENSMIKISTELPKQK